MRNRIPPFTSRAEPGSFKQRHARFFFGQILLGVFLATLAGACVHNEEAYPEQAFASGPINGSYFPYARGIIDALTQTTGIFLKNTETQGSWENAQKLVNGQAYMGLVQQDVFSYAGNRAQSDATALEIASSLRVIMTAYEEDVHLLVNTTNVTDCWNSTSGAAGSDGVLNIDDLYQCSAKKINLGPVGSGTLMTAEAVSNLQGGSISHTYSNDSIETAVSRVVAGSMDALYYVTAQPASALQGISASAPVRLISATIPAGVRTEYKQTGTIYAEHYPFQSNNVNNNLRVKTLLAISPDYQYYNIPFFIDYLFANAYRYADYHAKWSDLSAAASLEYLTASPLTMNREALQKFTGFQGPATVQSVLATGPLNSNEDKMGSELLQLFMANTGILATQQQTSGGYENIGLLFDGKASLAILPDDLLYTLSETASLSESLKVAAIRKILPLNYLYVQLIARPTSCQGAAITGIKDFPNGTGHKVNIPMKTTNAFFTIQKILESYQFSQTDNITFTFDSDSNAISNLTVACSNSNAIDAMLVVAPWPYSTVDVAGVNVLQADFKDGGTRPSYYELETGLSGYTNVSSATTSALRVRNVLVASAFVENSASETFIKSVFRKGYYLGSSASPCNAIGSDANWKYVCREDALNYVRKSPFGWSNIATRFYNAIAK